MNVKVYLVLELITIPETRRAKTTRDAIRPAGSADADAATSTLSEGPKLSGGACVSEVAGSCKINVNFELSPSLHTEGLHLDGCHFSFLWFILPPQRL